GVWGPRRHAGSGDPDRRTLQMSRYRGRSARGCDPAQSSFADYDRRRQIAATSSPGRSAGPAPANLNVPLAQLNDLMKQVRTPDDAELRIHRLATSKAAGVHTDELGCGRFPTKEVPVLQGVKPPAAAQHWRAGHALSRCRISQPIETIRREDLGLGRYARA